MWSNWMCRIHQQSLLLLLIRFRCPSVYFFQYNWIFFFFFHLGGKGLKSISKILWQIWSSATGMKMFLIAFKNQAPLWWHFLPPHVWHWSLSEGCQCNLFPYITVLFYNLQHENGFCSWHWRNPDLFPRQMKNDNGTEENGDDMEMRPGLWVRTLTGPRSVFMVFECWCFVALEVTGSDWKWLEVHGVGRLIGNVYFIYLKVGTKRRMGKWALITF